MLRYILGTQRKFLKNLFSENIPQHLSSGSSSSITHNKIIAVLDHDPEAEADFARRASEYPTMYAFHGTGADCIYSLQRNGLRNLSNSNYMTCFHTFNSSWGSKSTLSIGSVVDSEICNGLAILKSNSYHHKGA